MKKKHIVNIHINKKKHIIYIYKKKKHIVYIKFKKNKLIFGIGIDLGIKEYAIIFNNKSNTFIHYPNIYKTSNKIKELLNKKKIYRDIYKYDEYNKNIHLNKINNKIDKLIIEYINKIIDSIINQNPNFVSVEDLNIKEMKDSNLNNPKIKNAKLLNNIIDSLHWDYFIHQLQVKCNKNNIDFIKVPQYYASSQICSNCGSKLISMKELDKRYYICNNCNTIIQRDENASININKEGCKILYKK